MMAITTNSSTSVKPCLFGLITGSLTDSQRILSKESTGRHDVRYGGSFLFCLDVEIEFEWTFLFHFYRVLTLGVPVSRNFGLGRRWQGIARHVTGRQRRSRHKIGDRHAILSEHHAFVGRDGIAAADNSSAALKAAIKHRMELDVSLVERPTIERHVPRESLSAARIFRTTADKEGQCSKTTDEQ